MGIGGLLLGLGMWMLQLGPSFSVIILICIIITVGEMLAATLSELICFESSSKEIRGKAMSYYRLLYSCGTITGAYLGGNIQTYIGLTYVWLFCGFIGLILFLTSIRYFKVHARKEILSG